MTGLWLPLAVTVLALALTYACCIRPMLKQGGRCVPPSKRSAESVDEEIRRTREELGYLREQAARAKRGDGSLDATRGAGRIPPDGPSGG
ncbi:hypothetical protein J7E96_31255 [Streptomyces sp. ISL-96]|uniref:hypothetical protein n=1 Tax=Streptomyces sp. ISL-96 TaxID=2819191 RepID=UPI001BEA0B23|nr:hypothetical protein [Streptomyces sp. ISL-96]MBT2492910.1 hypothetical protein [Streptomyces sp. ISL-96]